MQWHTPGKGLYAILLVLLAMVVIFVASYPRIREVEPDPGQQEFARQAGLPIAFTNKLGMVFRLIPSGVYARGSPPDERGRRADEFAHPVRIARPFYLGATEVTQEQFETIMAHNPSFFRGRDGLPVEYLSWEEAIRFCNRLSEREGRAPAYTVTDAGWHFNEERDGYRLPTEAEWEFACRAGTETPFYTGRANPIPIGRDNAWRAAWHRHNARGRTQPVGLREPNAWGLYDMSGNVWEWCWDRYAPYPRTADPLAAGPVEGALRVMRGGGWYSPSHETRSAVRRGRNPDLPWNSLGFRVAVNAGTKPMRDETQP